MLYSENKYRCDTLKSLCKKAMSSSGEEDVGFSNVPGNISLAASCLIFPKMQRAANLTKPSKSYKAHCLRATAIKGMNDAGFEGISCTSRDIKTNPLLHLGPMIEIA